MFNCLRCKDTGWKSTRPHYVEVDGKKIKASSMIRCGCDKKVKPKLKREELRMLAAWNEAAREINNCQPLKLQQALIKKIKDPRWKQKDIAKEYSAAIQEYVINGQDLNWPAINRAIIDRWGRLGLKRIKEMAWKGDFDATRVNRKGL